MSSLLYLSAPYSSPDPSVRLERARRCRRAMAELMAGGKLVVCPVAMNHEAVALLTHHGSDPGGAYWRGLEERLAEACDELAVLQLPGWDNSRGVAREIALFEAMGKTVTFIDPIGSDHDEASDVGEVRLPDEDGDNR